MARLFLVLVVVLASARPFRAQIPPLDENGLTMGHVHLNVTDVDAQKKFWKQYFAGTDLQREGLAGVKVRGMLILFTRKDPTRGSEGTTMDHFGFRVPSLDAMRQSLTAGGFEVRPTFKGTEGFDNAYVIGPDKVKIEMQQDVNLKEPEVNHLHYVLRQPMPLRDWYVQNLGATPTKRGSYQTANVSTMNLTYTGGQNAEGAPTKGAAIDHIGFEVKDLEAYCKKLEAKGIKLDVPYRKLPNLPLAIAFITDPNGVYIELTEGLTSF